MAKFAIFDENGFPTAFYWQDNHTPEVPVGVIEITEEQWLEFVDNSGLRRWDGSKVVEYTPPTPEPEPVVTILPAVTLWERLTEDEADQVNDAMATQPVRTQRIFTTVNTFRSDHELWPMLEQIAIALFGKDRACEILTPVDQEGI